MWDYCSLGTRFHMPRLCFRRVITHPANSNFTYRIYTQEWRWTESKTCLKMRLRAPGHPLSCGMCHWIPTWSVWTMGILSTLGFLPWPALAAVLKSDWFGVSTEQPGRCPHRLCSEGGQHLWSVCSAPLEWGSSSLVRY